MLHNKHVMVRVGGGWETFESYLLKHDPCRMLQISRVEGKMSPVKSQNIKDLSPDSYLVVAAHYRSKKWSYETKGANDKKDTEGDIILSFSLLKACSYLTLTSQLAFVFVRSNIS